MIANSLSRVNLFYGADNERRVDSQRYFDRLFPGRFLDLEADLFGLDGRDVLLLERLVLPDGFDDAAALLENLLEQAPSVRHALLDLLRPRVLARFQKRPGRGS